jgi:hypothetical protein
MTKKLLEILPLELISRIFDPDASSPHGNRALAQAQTWKAMLCRKNCASMYDAVVHLGQSHVPETCLQKLHARLQCDVAICANDDHSRTEENCWV